MQSARFAVLAIVLFPAVAMSQQVTTPNDKKEVEQRRSADRMNGKTLFEWTADLKNTDPSVRLRAIATLKAYGKMAQNTVPDLVKALSDKDASTRVNACITLGMIGCSPNEKNEVLNKIAILLNDSQGIVRYQAALALSKFGTSANYYVPRLKTLTKDPITWEIRAAACAALAAAGVRDNNGIDPVAWLALINALSDPCFEVKLAALQSLLFIGRPALNTDTMEEMAALRALYNDRNPIIAIWAHLCTMRIDKVDDVQLNAIAHFLKSAKPEARAEACKAFAIIGPDARVKDNDKTKANLARTKDIINRLEDKDAVTTIWACAALAQMKEKSALPRLRIVATSNPDSAVRLAATQCIAHLDGDKKGANNSQLVTTNPKELEKKRAAQEVNGKTLNDWMVDLRSTDPSIKLKAIANIKGFGDAGQAANNAIMLALRDKDASTKINACITLAATGVNDKYRAECIRHLIVLLSDTQGTVRYQAATTLSAFGYFAADAIPRLVTLSKDPITWEIRQVACTALATTGLQKEKGIDARAWNALLDVLHDTCFEVRYAALKGLLYMGRPTAQAEVAKESTALQALFNDKSEIVAIWAPLCYMRINGVSEANLLAIAKHLRSENADVRAEACRAFAIIGPEAKSQANTLIDQLEDKDSTAVVWSITAIAQMKDSAAVAIPKLKTLSTGHAEDSVRRAATEAIKRLEGDTKASSK